VPQRTSCAARDPWYDLTRLVKPGFALWPMAQQYRHIIPGNPERLICNHNLFDLSSELLSKKEQKVLVAVLNSTLVGLFKTFYGRFAGTEGNLKTEVIDVNLIEIPDPREVERKALVDRLHEETASHFRAIRVTEIQKMEDRAKGGKREFTTEEQAADAWDAVDLTDLTPLSDWVRNHAEAPTREIVIPDERPADLAVSSMFDHEVVYFGKKRQEHVVCPTRGTAELLARIANLGVSGPQVLPIEDDVALHLLCELE